MERKIFTIFLAVCLVFTLSATAFATDGVAADGPKDAVTVNPSTGAATVTHDGTNFQAENDDDAVAKADETTADGTDISLWGRITSTPVTTPVYKIDVTWGNLMFTFNSDSGVWNPATHSYEPKANGSTAFWGLGTKNEEDIKGTSANYTFNVINHSNRGINAAFHFDINGTVFNDDSNNPNKVVGNFFEINTDNLSNIMSASKQLTNTATVRGALSQENRTMSLSGASVGTTTPPSKRVAFRLSGTPDFGKTINNFSKIGTITVTFAMIV